MSRTRPTARVSVRLVAVLAAVASLIGVGGLVASPAFAYGDLSITVLDSSNGDSPYTFGQFTITPESGSPFTAYSGATGVISVGSMIDGNYTITPDDLAYVQDPYSFSIGGGLTTSGTYYLNQYSTIIGSVPAGAGSSNTLVTIQSWNGSSWDDLPGYWVVFETDDTFSFPLQSGPGTYRLWFQPSADIPYFDSYSTTVVDTAYNSVHDIGAVSFEQAAMIEGTVLGGPSSIPIVGGDVYAQGDENFGSDETDSSGNYHIKLPLEEDNYTVYIYETGYAGQYWDHESDPGAATLITPAVGNGYFATDIDFDLDLAAPSVYGNTLTTVGGSLDDFDVDYYLFKDDGTGNFGPVAFDESQSGDDFYYDQLPDGTYRLAFADPDDGRWLPWQTLDLNGAPQTAGVEDCFVQFDVVLGTGDISLSSIVLDSTQDEFYCESPPWAPAGAGLVTGTVTNILDMTGPIRASLWEYEPFGSDLFIDSSPVDPSNGGYTLTGVVEDGDYYVVIETSDLDPYLDAVLGSDAGVPYWIWADDPSSPGVIGDSFPLELTALTDSYSNDITLDPATVFHGTISSDGTPVADACVNATRTDDSTYFVCTSSKADGSYALKVPPGYEWYLGASAYGYDDQYWEGHSDVGDSDSVGPTSVGFTPSTYDFDLFADPPLLLGALFEEIAGPVDDVIVHLYKPVTGGYAEVATTTTSGISFPFNFEFDDSVLGPVPSSYRLRFETPAHDWIVLSEYGAFSSLTSASSDLTDGPACYIDVPTVHPGPETIAVGIYDDADQAASPCTAEPVVSGGGGGGGGGTGGSGGTTHHHSSAPAVVSPTPTATPTPTPTPTETPTATPSEEPSASPTAAPPIHDAPADLSWLLWALIVLGVLGVGSVGFFLLRRR